ncbi:MAG: Sir2 family NAD-dependent protein deacetylase [Candidatus Brocadiaceae bacterium]|nr:Sir2 family NAD-dependent protein deacetylase [Candidatus Brocadiaceae bacterium]
MSGTLIEKAGRLIQEASNIVALTGAGISTSAGIPDFRSPESGLWNDPEKMLLFTSLGFAHNPRGFYELGQQLLPLFINARPTKAHLFLARLEEMGRLRCVITQNIDGLHQEAGSKKVLEVHGSLREGRCIGCGKGSLLREMVRKMEGGEIPPLCDHCKSVIRPNIILFGEPIPQGVFQEAMEELRHCDLLLVIGSSLVVYPVAEMPLAAIEHNARLILLNRLPSQYDSRADVVLQMAIEEAVEEIQNTVGNFSSRRS